MDQEKNLEAVITGSIQVAQRNSNNTKSRSRQ